MVGERAVVFVIDDDPSMRGALEKDAVERCALASCVSASLRLPSGSVRS